MEVRVQNDKEKDLKKEDEISIEDKMESLKGPGNSKIPHLLMKHRRRMLNKIK
jgi:hypothetical protein